MGERYAKRRIYCHNEAGAIRTVCQAASAVYIGVTYELTCIICDSLSIGTGGRAVALEEELPELLPEEELPELEPPEDELLPPLLDDDCACCWAAAA